MNFVKNHPIMAGAAAFFSLVVLITLWSSYAQVPSGFVGVKSTFGKVHQEPMEEGGHLLIPYIQKMKLIDTKLNYFQLTVDAATKDLQKLSVTLSVQHSLTPSLVPKTYTKVGDLEAVDDTIVRPGAEESFKAVSALFTAEECITMREKVKIQSSDELLEFINKTLKDKGLEDAVHISNVAIIDFKFSPEFDKSIETKMIAQQEALRAKNEKEKQITQAEAKAAQQKLEADAESYQIQKISTERAAAIQREAEAIAQNPLILQLRSIEKWNGILPTYMMGGDSIPFVQLNPSK